MSRAMWVTRDARYCQWYRLHEKKPLKDECNAGDYSGLGYLLCSDVFQRITGLRRKPGEGPVKVTIEVKRVQ